MFIKRRMLLAAALAAPIAWISPWAAGVGASTAPPGTGEEVALDRDATVRFAYAGPINSLDPHKATISTWPVYDFFVYDRLWEVDSNLELVPQLATEWEFADDASTFDVVMRDDVVFHDGASVDAEAVRASIERGKTLEDSTVTSLLSGITEVEVVDEFTVRFHLDGVGAELPTLLSTNAGAIMNPAVFGDPDADLDVAPPVGAGSGPYVVTQSEPNVSTTFARAPEYWDPTAGNLAEFSITFVPQTATRLAALQAGDFDLVQVSADGLETAHADFEAGRYQLITAPASTRDLLLNSERGDLANPDIRRAIALGINREEFGILQPCEVITQPYPENHWSHNADIAYTYDPETAAQLVSDAGGASFEITFAAGSSYEPVATVIQGQLGDLGFDVSLRPSEQSATNPPFASGERDALITSISPSADPALTIGQYFTGGLNVARGDAAAELASSVIEGNGAALSADDRAGIFQDIWAGIIEANLYIPICQSVQGWAYTSDLVGLADTPGLGLGLPVFTRLGVAAS